MCWLGSDEKLIIKTIVFQHKCDFYFAPYFSVINVLMSHLLLHNHIICKTHIKVHMRYIYFFKNDGYTSI